jgi:pantothenate synthetase
LIHVSNTLAAWRTRRRALEGGGIGFVPIRGALHQGHSSLVEHTPVSGSPQEAAYLFRALSTAASCAEAGAALEARCFVVEYVEERWARRLGAVYLDGVRLIDNVPAAQIRTPVSL